MAEAKRWWTRRRQIVAKLVVLVVAVGWWFSAYPRGMIEAWVDGWRGRHEIKVFGLPSPCDREYARLIRERYGVKVNRVAGCVVTQDLVSYVEGYNLVAEPRIRARYGKDIFAECDNKARAAWDLAHPRE